MENETADGKSAVHSTLSNETPIFGLRKERSLFDEYIGEYVKIQRGVETQGGLVREVSKDGRGILNPFIYLGYNCEGIQYAEIKEGNLSVMLGDATITPDTLDSLVGFCKYYNRQNISQKGNRIIVVRR